MTNSDIRECIKSYQDFPKKGILYRDVLPLLQEPELLSQVTNELSSIPMCKEADAIIGIESRGFIFGTAIATSLSKPLILARKPGKLPGNVITKSYDLEYGSTSLSIQKDSLDRYNKYVIVDDLLATGGTVESIISILSSEQKIISGVCVVIELLGLGARGKCSAEVYSMISY